MPLHYDKQARVGQVRSTLDALAVRPDPVNAVPVRVVERETMDESATPSDAVLSRCGTTTERAALGAAAVIVALGACVVTWGCAPSAREEAHSTESHARTEDAGPVAAPVGRYIGRFEAFFEGTDLVDVPIEITVAPSGVVRGSWDHTTNVTVAEGEARWATSGSFVAHVMADGEFVGQGTAGERLDPPASRGSGVAGLFQVRAVIDPDGLIIGTLFFETDSRLLQAVATD